MPETEKKIPAVSEKKLCPCHGEDCRGAGYEYVEVGIPVELTPRSKIRRAETECVGVPVVTCEGGGESCCLVITQKVRVKIPFRVGVSAKAGEDFIRCACRGDDPGKPEPLCPCHKSKD